MVGGHDSEDLRPATALGPYDLVLQVGVGGMARVWVARVRATGQLVALKVLLSHLAENTSFRQMFSDEARIASRVKHPNVCATHELADYDGILAIAMEWIDGAALDRILRPGPENDDDAPRVPLPFRHAARIVADACAGLHAAHELRGDDGQPLAVVHRDVSPHNILLTADGKAKVTDFGVAKALGKSHMTLAGQVKGKLAYMSPEQLMGSGVDRRSDVFALGGVLYEITVGQRPFQGEHDPQVMAAIVMGNYERPSAVRPGYPAELEAIIVRALAIEPAERFATAEDMRRALEQWLATSGPPVGQPQVAALLQERCGPAVAARLRAVRLGRPFSTPPQVPVMPLPSTTARPRMDPGETGPMSALQLEPRGHGLGFFVAAALVGAIAGGGILLYARSLMRQARARTVTTTGAQTDAGPSTSASSSPPEIDAAPPPVVLVPEASTPTPNAVGAGTIRLKIPPGASIVVDGVPMDAGIDTVARPTGSGTAMVLVRADKFQDTIILVDGTTPDEVEVTLLPMRMKSKTKPEAGAGSGAAGGGAGGGGGGGGGNGGTEEPTPPNPYQ